MFKLLVLPDTRAATIGRIFREVLAGWLREGIFELEKYLPARDLKMLENFLEIYSIPREFCHLVFDSIYDCNNTFFFFRKIAKFFYRISIKSKFLNPLKLNFDNINELRGEIIKTRKKLGLPF